MSIIRIKKGENPFVQIDHRPLCDPRISWRAKGVLAYLLSKPDNWEVISEHLIKQSTEGRDAVRAAFKELKEFGYAKLETRRGENGRVVGQGWVIQELPDYRGPENPALGNATERLENRLPEKPSAGKTATSNKDFFSKKEKKNNKATPFRKPILEEVAEYGEEIDLKSEDVRAFMDHHEARGWKLKGVLMVDWRAALRTWKRNADKFNPAISPARTRQSIDTSSENVWTQNMWLLCHYLRSGDSLDRKDCEGRLKQALQYATKKRVMEYTAEQLEGHQALYDQINAVMNEIPDKGNQS